MQEITKGGEIRSDKDISATSSDMITAQALRESEERFFAAVRAVQATIWTNSPSGEMQGDQPGWMALTGQTEDEYRGFGWASVVHPEDAQPTIDAWHKAVQQQSTFEFEHRVRVKSGEWRLFSIRAVPVFTSSGEIREWVGVHTDITSQREAEKTIRESEKRFRLMADSSPVMIWTLDAEGNSTYYNKKALEFTGHTADDLQSGKSWQMAIHPDDIEDAGKTVAAAVSEVRPYEMECRMRRADGEWRWLLSHGTPRLGENGELLGYVGSSVDITERKTAEQSLKRSEDRYQNFIKQSTEGIWRFELSQPMSVDLTVDEQIDYFFKNAHLAECNDAMARMYGYERSEELKDFTLENFFRRDEDTEAYFRYFIESGYRVENTESKEIDRYGEIRWFSNNLVGIIENGMIYRAWGTQRDITAQKSAEESLAKSERYFRELTDTVPAIIWITRPDGYCTYLNKNWYEFTGQSFGEAEGFGWLNATHPDDAAEAERLFTEATAAQKPYYILYRLRHKSGTYRWAIDSGHPKFSKDGLFEGMIGTVIDVHEQKLAEDRIKESEEKFRTLAESLPQLVWMTDAHGNQEYASQRWEEYSGVAPSGNDTWSSVLHPDDVPVISEVWRKSLDSGAAYRTEARLRNKDGEYRWHFIHGEAVRNEEKKIVKWIGAITDIHDQKTQTEKLEGLIADRTRELTRSNDDLQQFAHVASHDLKEPVRKIKTFAGRLATEDEDRLSETGKKYLAKMHSAADRMSSMIEGVLNYSTLNAHEQSIQKVDLTKLIRNIETDLELVFQQKKALLRYHDLPVMDGSNVLLYQLFYNLVNNSLKFSKADTAPLITVACDSKIIDGREFAEITIADNGIGFDQEQADKIFDTFVRLHSKDRYEGTGLGLALCKKIVERHGGQIRAYGSPNKGARFEISLPMNQEKNNI
jgi:PAS domain S-box-containing protein